jgi:anti-sigma B factor antagonist
MPSLVEVKSSVQGTTQVVAVRGEIDLSCVDKIQKATDAALSQGPETMVLDLSAVTFCDSSGIELVVRCHRRAEAQGVRLVVVRPTGPAWRPFEICNIDRQVQFVEPDHDASNGSAPSPPPRSIGSIPSSPPEGGVAAWS